MKISLSRPDSPAQNRLLATLSEEVQARLFPHMELVELALGDVLHEAGEAPGHVFFPTHCIVSLVCEMADRASAEVSVVGNEGLIGLALLMGGESTSSRAIVRRAGNGYCLPGHIIKEEFYNHGELLALVLRFTQALITQMAQIAVCNRHHTVDQQLCRWLLLSLDRQRGNKLAMTQELIANLLGVRREGVAEAAGKLQKLNMISYARGKIAVLDRAGLEQLSCECYRIVKAETDRLLPRTTPERPPVIGRIGIHDRRGGLGKR